MLHIVCERNILGYNKKFPTLGFTRDIRIPEIEKGICLYPHAENKMYFRILVDKM